MDPLSSVVLSLSTHI